MTHVLILQEYVPAYRVRFYESLLDLARTNGIELTIAVGAPNEVRSRRGDAQSIAGVLELRQREFRLGGRRVVIRKTSQLIKDADLVIMEQARRNLDVYRLLIPRFARSTRIALWGHGRDYAHHPNRFEAWLLRQLTRRADWFFGYTKAGVAAAIQAGIDQSRSTVVMNATDTSSLKTAMSNVTDSDKAAFIEAKALTHKTAIYIGGLDTIKRIPFLLECAALAHALDSEFRLLIVGDGVDRNLVEAASSSDIGVVYLGPLFGAERALALSVAKVIAMPGAVGLVAVDSFAAGTPIVTTQWPLHGPEFDYLGDGRNAIVTENTQHDYVTSLLRVLNSDDELRNLRKSCLEDARIYTIENMTRNFMQGIGSALEARGPSN